METEASAGSHGGRVLRFPGAPLTVSALPTKVFQGTSGTSTGSIVPSLRTSTLGQTSFTGEETKLRG